MATSRTAGGVIDTSASPDKADEIYDISGDQAASLAANNYRDVIARAYADRNRQFGSPQEVRDFVEGMAAQVNGGILKGPLLRQHDSDKYPYTPAAQLPQAADEFYTQLHEKLNDPAADPVDTAAWAEYHVNPGHHFFGDGSGRGSRALSSYILMRNGLPLPTYPGGNEEYFKNVTRETPIGQDPEADAQSFDNFLRYYRSMMPGQQKTSAAPPGLTVADSAPGADRPLMLVYGGGFNPPHQGHVGALRSAYDALAGAGYTVGGSVVAPTADKLLAKKKMDEALRLGLQDRAAVARAAFPPDINGSPVSIRTEPADEIERGTTKPRRSDLARWAQSQYPDHTIVNVSGEDAAVPGAPGVFPSLYSGEIGSNHEGVNYITLPRDPVESISSSKIRAALSGGGPLEGMTPESEKAYRDALARHQAAQAPMAVTGGRTLWAADEDADDGYPYYSAVQDEDGTHRIERWMGRDADHYEGGLGRVEALDRVEFLNQFADEEPKGSRHINLGDDEFPNYQTISPRHPRHPNNNRTAASGRTLWASFCREWGVGTTHRRASIHDHMHELDDDGMPHWLDDPYERAHAQALRDLGEERSFAQYLADRAYNNFMDIEKGPDENLAETWWGRSGQADDYLRSLGGEV